MFIGSEDDEDEELNDVITPGCVDKLASDCKKWLQSVDGRGKSERCSKARSRQVVPILKTISPLEFDVKELFNRFLLRNDWLSKFDKVAQPVTVWNYLNSLKQFYEYILCDKPEGLSIEDCHFIMTLVSNWSLNYMNKVKKEEV